MTPLPLWQLLLALATLLIVGRLLAGWIWKSVSGVSPTLGQGIMRLTGRSRLLPRLERRSPRAAAFLASRVARDRFSGLPLTLMAILALYLVFLGIGLLDDVLDSNQVVAFDHYINSALSVLRNPDFLQLMAAITSLASIGTVVAVVTVSAGLLWAHRRIPYMAGLLVSVIGSQTLTYIGKYAVDRHRPDFLTFASASTPSFPSGHATAAIALYGFIIYAIARDIPGSRRRFELAYWGSALIALIAFSRAMLSVHFASDIAEGLLVGGFWLLAGCALTEYLRERAGHRAGQCRGP